MEHPRNNLWFKGVCDSLLRKMEWWRDHYDEGVITATRPYLDPVHGVVDMPTQRGHELPLTQDEADHLVRIMSELKPNSSLTEDLKKVQSGLKRGARLPGRQFAVILKYFKQDTVDICNALLEARDGKQFSPLDCIRKSLSQPPPNS